ncbi:alpha/beta fold hydrolase [Roseovarius sp. M141]|uniref:alpha/beta fold hydrolase n=1 Tax=Roseovarius sp. M141 TaxID=2583806 RepID=UPI0020CD9E35|nr:alpha/beta hydrolase [Roseovarius sp. M141]MCQ0093277.1 alpha/beta hydrolase [Roseovarius sp. M141]
MAHFTTSDGLSLHYSDTAEYEGGDGPPILCLAGLTRNSADFRLVLPFLAGYRVIRMDYRGRGQSDYADDITTYSVPQEAQDAIALLDHLGLERATILGTSRGGLIAMLLAATHPGRLNGAILNDIGPELAPGGLDRIKEYVGRRPIFRTYDEAAEGLSAVNDAQFPGVTLARWRLHAENIWAEQPGERLALRYDPRLRDALMGQAGALPAPDLWPFFDALASMPLTVLHGANSDLLSADLFARMQARAPTMRAFTVPDRGHVPFLDEAASLDGILSHLRDYA